MTTRYDDQERYSAQMERVEHTLLYLSDTKKRAGWKRDELVKMQAEQHVIDALERTIQELDDVHKRLMQGTYWYVSPEEMEAATAGAKARRGGVRRAASHRDAAGASMVAARGHREV